MDLWHDFLLNRGKGIHKWTHYFPIYERHFAPWRGRSLTFLEIGVDKGGSMQMWQRYFGPMAKIIGIDIDETTKQHEQLGVSVRIGDQGDPKFLQKIVDEFGIPDVVLDDGSHKMGDIYQTFQFLYPKMPKNGVYMVEDLHCAYWQEYGGGLDEPKSFINISKHFIDRLNAEHTRGALEPDAITRQTFGISFYDSIVVYEKGDVWRKDSLRTGNNIK